jgi:hypothetical protein
MVSMVDMALHGILMESAPPPFASHVVYLRTGAVHFHPYTSSCGVNHGTHG